MKMLMTPSVSQAIHVAVVSRMARILPLPPASAAAGEQCRGLEIKADMMTLYSYLHSHYV